MGKMSQRLLKKEVTPPTTEAVGILPVIQEKGFLRKNGSEIKSYGEKE